MARNLVAGLCLLSTAAGAATVSSASPQGDVARAQQVVLRFDGPVAALSDGRTPDPAQVRCQGPVPPGAGRWVTPQHWVYDFRSVLPPGVSCTVSLRDGWKPLDGAPVAGNTRFSFQTGGPVVERISPYQGAQIEEDQHFLLQFNGPPSAASVAAQAWCEVEGIGERVPVRVVTGAVRDALIQQQRRQAVAQRLVLVHCARPLANEAKLRLVLGPGVAAAANPAVVTRTPSRFEYTVRRAFQAELSCERERAQAPCLPIRPVVLRFSEAVPRALAQQVRLRPAAPGAAALAPVLDPDDREPELTELRFPTPLAENSRYTVELPPNLKDSGGRPLANAGSFPLVVATGEAPPIAKFAAAPFGILERHADPALPVTLRRVQGDLRPAAPGGQVRVLRLLEPLEMLKAYARVQQWHESQITAQAAGLPRERWMETVVDKDERGREVKRRVERLVATRELSLLKTESAAKRLDLPALQGGDPRPFEVVGIPLREPGLHVVEIESGRLGEALLPREPKEPVKPMFVRTAVLVTNLAVHVKLGRSNSLVWVTTLDRAKPVAEAEVQVADCAGKPLWQGRTDAQGRASIPQALPAATQDCLAEAGWFVSARKADAQGVIDSAFVFSSWSRGIEPWRFNLNWTGPQSPNDPVAHTVFDRTLLRAGETVSMKHFIRAETPTGLALLPSQALPSRVRITHEGSGQEQTLALQWSGARHALSQWAIPAAAKLGSYRVTLERDGAPPAGPQSWPSGSFRVEAFRVPLVEARLVGPRETQIAPKELALAVQMNFSAGGAMAQAPLRGTAQWRERAVSFAAYPEYSFQPPRDTAARGGSAPELADSTDDSETADRAARLLADRTPLTTDNNGAARWVLPLASGAATGASSSAAAAASKAPSVAASSSTAAAPAGAPAATASAVSAATAAALAQKPGEIRAELSYADPNGETQTVSTRVATWPSAVVLGLKSSNWVSAKGRVAVSAVALDVNGQALPGQAVQIHGRLVQTLSTRKRMVGGFYAYDNRTEVQDLGVLCEGKTDHRGLLPCDAQLARAGEVELVAQAVDSAGRRAQTATSVWVTRQGELWFAQDNDDRIDVLADKPRYEPGETAKLQLRAPFREATALVSVERDGVIDTRVTTLRGQDPTLELPIDKSWGPNVTVTVLAVRGRVRDVPWTSFFQWGWKAPMEWLNAYRYEGQDYQAPTALVDLAKPSAKLGAVALQVGLAEHELKVQVSTDQPVYRIRGKALARIRVTNTAGQPVPGAEVAFAAVDEGLLALWDNSSWDLLHGVIRERAWVVQTATALSEVIGRRHYGRKAVAAGGGGGRAGARELFDTLLLWRPVVTLDTRGEATVEVPLNDSLTRFRLVAVADAGEHQFGSGHTQIQVTQDLQVLAGLPPLAREGDQFQALVTLRNTTARAVTVRASVSGTVEAPAAPVDAPAAARPLSLPPQDISLPANSARELSWAVTVPAGATRIQWDIAAQENGAPAGQAPLQDRVRVAQRVEPAVPLRVLQATLQQLDSRFSLPVAVPADALAAGGQLRGGLQVSAQASLGAGLPGLRAYFERYPYTCLEQQASVAIGLADANRWAAWVNLLPGYLDSDGLAAYFPAAAGDAPQGSDSLTAYLLSAAHEAGLSIPEPALGRMLQGLSAFVQGRIERRFWAPRSDLEVRKLAALAALSRHGKADARLLGSIRTAPQAVAQWPTAALIDALTVLQRLPNGAESNALGAAVQQQLRTRLDLSGSTLRFSTEDSDHWWWLMDSADANAAKLLLAVMDDPTWRSDVPRLVAGHLGRQQNGHWLTTTANTWSVLALSRFAQRFEAQAPGGQTVAAIGGSAPQRINWGASPQGGSLLLPWPAQAGSLQLTHEGAGKPWISVQSLAAVPLKAPLQRGYGISRSLQPVQQKTSGRWSRGDVLRVRLELDAQADMSWVVLSDPVPTGATVLGTGLGRDAALATAGERREGSGWVAFDERGADSFKRYFGHLPRGRHVVEYTLRLNNPGLFTLPPTRAEALYAPERFGEIPNESLQVQP